MKTRHFDILNHLLNESKKNYTISEIATITDVSERTIRYDIDLINSFLKEHDLPEIYLRKGEIFCNKDIDLNVLQKFSEEREIYDLDQNKRYELIMEYIFLNNGINITKFSRENFLSRGTIKNDLEEIKKEIKKEIKNFGIEILNTKEGIKVVGDEEVIRKKLLAIFNIKRIKKYMDFHEIEKNVEKILGKLERPSVGFFGGCPALCVNF